MAVLCVEQVLKLAEFLLIMGDLSGRGLVALVAVREGGVHLLEFYFGSRRNFEPFHDFHLLLFSACSHEALRAARLASILLRL